MNKYFIFGSLLVISNTITYMVMKKRHIKSISKIAEELQEIAEEAKINAVKEQLEKEKENDEFKKECERLIMTANKLTE